MSYLTTMGNRWWRICILTSLLSSAWGNDILKTSGFTTCMDNADVTVQRLNIQYDRQNKQVTFDVAGTSEKEQKVTASLSVSAYGKQVYQKDFNPCDNATLVQQLCPVPKGSFAAKGIQDIPDEYAGKVPSIAFNVPDLEGQAKLKLKALDGGADLACIQSDVNNGRTIEAPAISYIAVGITGAALLLSGVSLLGSAGTETHTPSPGFGDVLGWFQSVSMNGMLSVQYPPVYRSFTKNFAFSGGLISWNSMQTSIDNFRAATGGNLTYDSVQYLRNATVVYDERSGKNDSSLSKRGLLLSWSTFEPTLVSRDNIETSTNGTSVGGNSTSPGDESKTTHLVHGIQGYVEQLTIPQANTFMTVLLIFAIVIAAIAVAILLFKVILETWALFASFPKRLTGFRKRYWGLMGRTITNLILILYGVWTLYCIFQFTHGDSWAAKLLAGLTLVLFSALLWGFTFRIWWLARKYKKAEGDTSVLFEDKEVWRRYSLFYDNYKRGYWWLFVPAIIYMFARGCVIAAGDGHGLIQTGGQLIVESIFMVLVLFARPFATPSSNWINIFIHIVRVLSVVCILVFVEELGIAQSTKTITGVVLIAVQSALTLILGILIAVNAIIICVRENPHRKRRKEAGKLVHGLHFMQELIIPQRNLIAISTISPLSTRETLYSSTRSPTPTRNAPRSLSHTRWTTTTTTALCNDDGAPTAATVSVKASHLTATAPLHHDKRLPSVGDTSATKAQRTWSAAPRASREIRVGRGVRRRAPSGSLPYRTWDNIRASPVRRYDHPGIQSFRSLRYHHRLL